MGLIGGIVGGVAGIGGGLLAAKAQNKAFKQQQDIFNQRLADVKAHRDNLYYQDPTQTAENQAAVTEAREMLAEQAKRAAATGAVTGGTAESVALQKAAASDAVGKMMQQQAAQGAAQKENTWNAADHQIDAFSNYLANSKLQQGLSKAQNISKAAGMLAQSAPSLI